MAAGWINLKAMFLYAADFFVMKPGFLMFIIGLILTLALSRGPIALSSRVTLDLHTMLLGITLATLGYGAIQLGTLGRVFYNFNPRRRRLAQRFTYNRGMFSALGLMLVGGLINASLMVGWIHGGLRLKQVSYPGMFGLAADHPWLPDLCFHTPVPDDQRPSREGPTMTTTAGHPASREEAYGQAGFPSWIAGACGFPAGPSVGPWAIAADLDALDLGCGYHAQLLRSLALHRSAIRASAWTSKSRGRHGPSQVFLFLEDDHRRSPAHPA